MKEAAKRKKEFITEFASRCSNEDDTLLRCISKLVKIEDEWCLNQIDKFLDNIQK